MSLNLLSILGDAMWIVAMAMIASGAQRFWKKLTPAARPPLPWGLSRRRAGRALAVGLAVAVPLVLGLALSAAARNPQLAPDRQLLLFLFRAFLAPLFVLAHYAWMRAAARALEADGQLRP
ncbi:hypothetical protein LRS10_06985 [Phenylobacterium sp. J426]|uniref:hypothetical protein n=1 Tax=Phenylobacterium sp. J426 TaxID=2898439 RepID=UPI00215086DC|nr:hypothetical protein [Phenylobacterium sp. J426]MCR5873938.1 hypothetical protein [Phenylobacterium sp. J426]